MTTLEQIRANFAWKEALKNKNDKYKNIAKGAPALIMSNGLMPSLAFWQSKKETQPIVESILSWLEKRNLITSSDFITAMENLQDSDQVKFREATQESLEFLKWLRNFVSAVC